MENMNPFSTKGLGTRFDDDSLHNLLTWLDAKSLSRLQCSSKYVYSLSQISHSAADSAWKLLSQKRWQIANHACEREKRVLNLGVWYSVWRLLDNRMRIPSGQLYTTKQNKVFGKGRSFGVDMWILVNHSQDAKLKVSHTGKREIELRIVLQNIFHDNLYLDTTKAIVQNKGAHGPLTSTSTSKLQLISRNGLKLTANNDLYSPLPLLPRDYSALPHPPCDHNSLFYLPSNLDFHVFCVSVQVDDETDSLLYETDFLSMTSDIVVNLLQVSENRSFPSKWTTIQADIIDEDEIWDVGGYVQLPGGVVLHQQNMRGRL